MALGILGAIGLGSKIVKGIKTVAQGIKGAKEANGGKLIGSGAIKSGVKNLFKGGQSDVAKSQSVAKDVTVTFDDVTPGPEPTNTGYPNPNDSGSKVKFWEKTKAFFAKNKKIIMWVGFPVVIIIIVLIVIFGGKGKKGSKKRSW